MPPPPLPGPSVSGPYRAVIRPNVGCADGHQGRGDLVYRARTLPPAPPICRAPDPGLIRKSVSCTRGHDKCMKAGGRGGRGRSGIRVHAVSPAGQYQAGKCRKHAPGNADRNGLLNVNEELSAQPIGRSCPLPPSPGVARWPQPRDASLQLMPFGLSGHCPGL